MDRIGFKALTRAEIILRNALAKNKASVLSDTRSTSDETEAVRRSTRQKNCSPNVMSPFLSVAPYATGKALKTCKGANSFGPGVELNGNGNSTGEVLGEHVESQNICMTNQESTECGQVTVEVLHEDAESQNSCMINQESTEGGGQLKNEVVSYGLRKIRMTTYNCDFNFESSVESSDVDSESEEYLPPSSQSSDGNDCSSTENDDEPFDRPTAGTSHAHEVSQEIRTREDSHSTVLQVSKTSNDGKRKYDKSQYCLFCEKSFMKVSRHWFTAHPKEREVIEIATEDDGKKKTALTTLLRNKGNHAHNCQVLREGRGHLVVAYRPKSEKDVSQYIPCDQCLGYYSRRDLYRHRCQLGQTRGKGRVVSKGAMLLPVPNGTVNEAKIILSGMISGPVKDAVMNDDLIMSLAAKLFLRHGHEKKELVRARVREVGRFLLEVQKTNKTASLSYFLTPNQFRRVISAVREVAGFDSSRLSYKCPSVAIKLGHTLRKCAQILRGQAIENDNVKMEAEAKQFKALCKLEWADEISGRARKELYERKRNAAKCLPLTEDTQKLIKYLKHELINGSSILETSKENVHSIWRHQAEVALAYVIVFNRRRQGEVSRLTLDDFSKARTGSNNSDIEGCLSQLEQRLCNFFYRLEIAGKRGRTVPLLMDRNVFEAITQLNQKRHAAGVVDSNIFVFACNCYGSMKHIRGCDCLRKFAVGCGAKHPETLKSTLFRKHVATVSQLLSLKDNELDMLAQFMGHDVRTHREFYRLPEDTLQLAKLSKLFVMLERGTLKSLSGKTLDKVHMDLAEEVEAEYDSLDENPDDVETAKDGDSMEDGTAIEEEIEEQVAELDAMNAGVHSDKDVTDEMQTYDYEVRRENVKKKPVKDLDKKSSFMLRQSSVKRVQRRWSDAEKAAVDRHLLVHILRKTVPKKEEILACMKAESELCLRSWKNIRDFCRNRINWGRNK